MGTRGPIAHQDRGDVVTRHPPTSVELAPERRRPPKAPATLGDAGKKAWRTYWRSPVAAAIADVDLPVLVRLTQTYDRLADPEVENKDFVALSKMALQLETALGVTAGARARLGIKLHQEAKPTLASIRGGLSA